MALMYDHTDQSRTRQLQLYRNSEDFYPSPLQEDNSHIFGMFCCNLFLINDATKHPAFFTELLNILASE